MRPLFLRLKGFKGVRSGSGKDEVEIDLSGHSGLVAVTGPNGSGKTTVLDNLHPFRIMPYRAGSYSSRAFSYYSECYGSDASRELHFEFAGRRFRSLLLIDADRKKQEAYLYERTDDIWRPLCDGKVENYDKVVTELLGSPQLFFTSVFRCQDAPRLSDYTKGEVKDIFVELLGIESLKKKGERAKEFKDSLLRETDGLKRDMERLAFVLADAEKAGHKVESIEREIRETRSELDTLEKEIEEAQTRLRKLQAEAAIREEAAKEKKALGEKATGLKAKTSRCSGVIVRADEIRKAVDEEKRSFRRIEVLKAEHSEVDATVFGLQKGLTAVREAESRLERLRKDLSGLEMERRHRKLTLEKELMRAEESTELLEKVPCDTAMHGKCLLLKNAVSARDSMPDINKALQTLGKETGEEKALCKEIADLASSVKVLPEIQDRLDAAFKKRQDLATEIAGYEKAVSRARDLSKLLPEVELAEKTLPELEAELKTIQDKLATINDNGDLSGKVDAASSRLRSLQERRRELLDRLSGLKQRLGSVEAVKKQGEMASIESKEIERKKEETNKEASEWTILEKALGNDGIIALEIDDAGPAISAIANDLLLSCFGPRFSVRIDTQAARASGKGLKETFDVVVLDSVRNETKSLCIMSGGEKVWIEEAITRAISLYNAQKSGRSYRGLFTDEKDGALDFQRKREFTAMKRRVIEVGGYDVEFFISQSPEVQEVADSRIDLS